MTTDISLRAAHAIQRQGKHLFSPLDSKAFVCLIGAVVFALEEVGAVRIEPAEPAHHGRILPRKMPEEAHLQAFYLRAVDKSVVAFFLDCTAEGETLQAEKDAFFHALASEPVKTDNEAHLARLQQGETEDPLLFSLLSACDLSRGLFSPPVYAALAETEPTDPATRTMMETLPLLWMLRFVK